MELQTALAGLVVGAVASGGVQSYLARSDRRRDMRSAARLLYMELHNSHEALEDLLRLQDWDRMITDWDSYGRAWEKHSEALAGALDTRDFHVVSAAFASMASVAASRAMAMKPGAVGIPSDRFMGYRANVEAARKIVFDVSFTRWETWRHRQPDLG
jgi:hypothetical protein